MIKFKDIRLEDKAAVDAVICASGCFGADYSFANLYIWRHAYEPQIFMGENRMLVTVPGREYYAYPKGDGDVKPYIEMLLEEAHERGEKLKIRGLTDRTKEEFLAADPAYAEMFEIIEDRDNADYVYMTDKLRYLAGRKLASKRNHIKHFEANGDWELKCVAREAKETHEAKIALDSIERPIATASIEDARAFVEEFYVEKGDPELEEEKIAIKEMFDLFYELGFYAAMLYQNGAPVAFTAGTRLGENGMDVHFEKALPGVEAAYTMINREYVNMMAQMIPEIEFFNREEDMGLEGLRRAKLSYKPDILMMKYFAVEK